MTRLRLSRVAVIAALLLGQLTVIGVALATESVVLAAALECIELILIGSIVLVARFRAVSRALRTETERAIALRERARLVSQLHDGLGHQLAVIALRASALQTAVPESARAAAEAIRAEAHTAVERLHQALDLLHAPDSDAADEIRNMFSRSRAAGASIADHSFELLPSLDTAVQSVVVATVREALTNALRHAPAAPITASLALDRGTVTITVQNPIPAGADQDRRPSRTGVGLRDMSGRIEGLGGHLDVESDQNFSIQATLPARPRRSATVAAPRRRSAALLLARDMSVAAAAALLLAAGCYIVTSSGTVLEPAAFARLHPGMADEQAAYLLPPRQAVIRLARTTPQPTSWRCRQYSDGNAPFAIASFQVCTDDGRITSVTDLRKQPWR